MSLEKITSSYIGNQNPLIAPFICGFDGTIHKSLEDLHDYLKKWRLSRAKYYQEYYPRKDPITGELIPFKSLEQYLSQDFSNKNTLKKWLKENPKEGFTWAKNWLAKRKEEKQLIYAPSQVELRSLCCPSMPYFDKIGAEEGGYYGIAASLGYKGRYKNDIPVYTPLAEDATIICDTREQKTLTFKMLTRRETINVGDYALDSIHDKRIRIERKDLSDFCGTLSIKGLDRFDRELARAQKDDLHVVMAVESTISVAQSFNYLPHMKFVKATPEYVFHNLRDLLTKYPLNFQCVFVDGRKEMAKIIVKLFEMGEQVRILDCQNLYEKGEL